MVSIALRAPISRKTSRVSVTEAGVLPPAVSMIRFAVGLSHASRAAGPRLPM